MINHGCSDPPSPPADRPGPASPTTRPAREEGTGLLTRALSQPLSRPKLGLQHLSSPPGRGSCRLAPSSQPGPPAQHALLSPPSLTVDSESRPSRSRSPDRFTREPLGSSSLPRCIVRLTAGRVCLPTGARRGLGPGREARGAPVTGLLPQGHLDSCGNWAPPLGRIGRCPSEPWTNSDQALCPSEKSQCPPHTHTQAGPPTKSHTPQQAAPDKLHLVSGRRFLTQRTAVRSLHGDPTSSDTETQTQQHWSLLPTHGCLLTPQTTTCLHTRESTQLWAQTYPPPSHNTPAHTCERLCRHRYAHPERRHTHMQPRHTDPQAESKAVRQPRPKHMPPRGVSNLQAAWVPSQAPSCLHSGG